VNYSFGWMKVVFDKRVLFRMKFRVDLGEKWIGLVEI
jgi:hypothetical protein